MSTRSINIALRTNLKLLSGPPAPFDLIGGGAVQLHPELFSGGIDVDALEEECRIIASEAGLRYSAETHTMERVPASEAELRQYLAALDGAQ
ncbi:MAG TPA: hypothetical protein VK988_02580 [Acidimicrobiales bacterium]|nr:hypothetical protein [Acidimicrobiales bacterium]